MTDIIETLEQKADKLIPSQNEYRLTDIGNAERFAEQHKDHVRYVTQTKEWIVYDGKKWVPGDDEKVRQLAQQTAKGFYTEAADEPDRDRAAKLARHGAASCSSKAISAMLREARPPLAIDSQELDNKPNLLNCHNGTMDIQTLTMREHRREDYITKIIPVIYDPKAKAPLFENTLARCLPTRSIDYLQKFFGYCTTGSIKEQTFTIWWGSGANGKSTILNAVINTLGDYAQITRPETFMAKRSDGIPSDVAKLKGARLVTAAEAEDGHRLAESAIKQWTGGDKVQARAMYKDWIEFTPEFKPLLCTNHKPTINGVDHAIWRRIRLIPFTETIPETEQDKNLPDKLNGELPGILNWILTGALYWKTEGLGFPDEIEEATSNYQSEQSVINIFLESCCTIKEDAQAEAGLLFKEFDHWRTNEGHRKLTQTKFGRFLAQLDFEKARMPGSGRMFYKGIGINER